MFLTVAAILVTVPLILAALLPRFAIPTIVAVLVLTGVLTAFELPLFNRFDNGGGFPGNLQFVFTNGFTSAWILAVVLLVRISGYRFGGPGTSGVSS